jgi:hypothetical protein
MILPPLVFPAPTLIYLDSRKKLIWHLVTDGDVVGPADVGDCGRQLLEDDIEDFDLESVL